MPGLSRKKRLTAIRSDQKQSRLVNGELKVKERARRDNRIKELLRKGKLPYTPVVMSWLSAKLNKPGTRITQKDVDAVLKG